MCAKSNEAEAGGALTRRQLAVLIEHMDSNHRALTEAVADVQRKIAESEHRLRGEIRALDNRLNDVHEFLESPGFSRGEAHSRTGTAGGRRGRSQWFPADLKILFRQTL